MILYIYIYIIHKEGRWVPHELTEHNLGQRVNTCLSLHAKYEKKDFLWKIVTGDEKYIYYENAKRKKSWVDTGQPSTSIPKQGIHLKKVLLCIGWDMKGVLYYELLEKGQTVTAERYSRQLNKLSEVLDKKGHLLRKIAEKLCCFTTMLDLMLLGRLSKPF